MSDFYAFAPECAQHVSVHPGDTAIADGKRVKVRALVWQDDGSISYLVEAVASAGKLIVAPWFVSIEEIAPAYLA